ncbi:hypothetical protein NFI96_028828, partial [Prochilodus magdalenae]
MTFYVWQCEVGGRWCSHCVGRVELSGWLVGVLTALGEWRFYHGETLVHECVILTFDQQDAEVVCRELGCGLPVEVMGGAAFGRLGRVRCGQRSFSVEATKSQIHSCPTSPSLKHNCSHDNRRVGLKLDWLVVLAALGEWRCFMDRPGNWYTVCGSDFDQQDAEVACRELGCGLPVEVAGRSCFWQRGGSGVWSEELQCRGNVESQISLLLTDGFHLCSGRGSGFMERPGPQCVMADFDQPDAEDAGVICNGDRVHEARVRFSGGMECKGEVEVYFRQEWRRVLLDSWSGSVASVVCRQLGCGSVFSFSSSSTSSPEHSHMCVTGLNCSGSEAHLGNCSSAQAVNCSSREQLYITCSGIVRTSLWGQNSCDIITNEVSSHYLLRQNPADHSTDLLFISLPETMLKLSGGNRSCSGKREVYHNAEWGSVCDDQWDIRDAQ